jgi:hypothetical protein
MTTVTTGARFPARPKEDRLAFLALTALVWVGVLSGFGTNSIRHISKHGLDYPLIVHLHALVFVGYLVVFTAQVALIRANRLDLHKHLGLVGAGLAAAMPVLGVVTAVMVSAARYRDWGVTPEFLAVQFTDMIAFVLLTGAGLLLRGAPSAHKRLMMLGLLYISSAGFSRFLSPIIAAPLGPGFAADLFIVFGVNDLLILALGAYDLATRRRLHPAYIGGVVVVLACQAIALAGYLSPAWKAMSLEIIGY